MNEDELGNLADFLKDQLNILSKINSEEIEMEAIYLEKPIIYNEEIKGWTCRMKPGDEIIVIGGEIVGRRLSDKSTHRVIGVYGTINSSMLSATVISLDTLELEILKLN